MIPPFEQLMSDIAGTAKCPEFVATFAHIVEQKKLCPDCTRGILKPITLVSDTYKVTEIKKCLECGYKKLK